MHRTLAAHLLGAILVLAQTPNPQLERWNKVFASADAGFNKQPNAFLLKSVQSMMPGTALEIGMGQGRNTIAIARLGWDVTIPERDGRAIRLIDLATHSSGLPREVERPPASADDPFGTVTKEACIAALKTDPLLFAPGTGVLYSNFAFDLLAQALAHAAHLILQSARERNRARRISPLSQLMKNFVKNARYVRFSFATGWSRRTTAIRSACHRSCRSSRRAVRPSSTRPRSALRESPPSRSCSGTVRTTRPSRATTRSIP